MERPGAVMPPLPGLEPKPEPEPEPEGAGEEGAEGASQGPAGDASPFSALAALSLAEGAAAEETLRRPQAQALAAHLSAEAPVFVPTVPSASSLDKLASGSAEADAPSSAEPAAASST
jgi:hypothetical protein